jgi:hypothetical protein
MVLTTANCPAAGKSILFPGLAHIMFQFLQITKNVLNLYVTMSNGEEENALPLEE